ncbi:DUF6370 domain-containing protein [Aquirufa beregesia]|nr:DUF6370 family protein [Aquirufa beregesia]
MKKIIYFLMSWFFIGIGLAFVPNTKPKFLQLDKKQTVYTVEASCGSCNFEMPGDVCQLAIKLDNKKYYVEGPNINDYGGSHSEKGFCKVVRKAQVQGKIVDNKFVASYFKLLP